MTLDSSFSSDSLSARITPLKNSASLDPSTLRFAMEYYYIDNFTARLVDLNSDSTYKLELAESIQPNKDNSEFTIRIKHASFSDGTPITATDVIQTIKRLILLGSPHSNPKEFISGASTLISMSEDINGLEKIDDRTFILRLNRPTKELFYYLHLGDYGVLHKNLYNKKSIIASDWAGVTSGPYKASRKNPITLIKNNNYYGDNKEAPEEISAVDPSSSEILAFLKNEKLDFGVLTFKEYLDNIDTYKNLANYSLFGSNTDGIMSLVLNSKSEIFKNIDSRRYIQNKIVHRYQIPNSISVAAQKANQYFLPGSAGYVENNNALTEEKKLNVPENLKGGVTIRTIPTAKPYLYLGIKEDLETALGIPVTIKFDVERSQYLDFLKNRPFDILIIPVSMSYKAIGESLNLMYNSPSPMFLDPDSTIRSLLKEYQSSSSLTKDKKIIKKIGEQMVSQSECIPLYYFSRPKFINSSKLNSKKMQIQESFQFWKLKVK